MRVARGPIAGQRVGDQGHAEVGHAQALAAVGFKQALDPAGGEQLNLDEILARPAGAAPELAQALQVKARGRGHGSIFARRKAKSPRPVARGLC